MILRIGVFAVAGALAFFRTALAADERRYDTRTAPEPYVIQAGDSFHYASAWGYARLSLTGGEIIYNVFANERSTIQNFATPVGGDSEALDEATFHMFAGSTQYAISRNAGVMNFFGTSVNYAAVTDDSVANLYGGAVDLAVVADHATLNVRGGTVTGSQRISTIPAHLQLSDNGTLNIYGRSFNRPQGSYSRSDFSPTQDISGWSAFDVAGVLADGTPFSWTIAALGYSHWWSGRLNLIVQDEPPPAPLPDTVATGFSVNSDNGDPVGGARAWYFVPSIPISPSFNATVSSTDHAVRLYLMLPGPVAPSYWMLCFAPPKGALLSEGSYENVPFYSGPGSMTPALAIYPISSPPSAASGSFTVKRATYSDGVLTSFWATFEQRARGAQGALRGEVRFNMPPPPEPTPEPSPTPEPTPPPRPPHHRADHRSPRISINGERTRFTRFDFAIISGRVTDNRRVKEVEISHGSATYHHPIKGSDYWYQLVDVAPGRNVFRITAIDAAGNKSKPERVVVIREGF